MACWVRDLFDCWRRQFGNSQSEGMWKMIPLCLMWCIRGERNNCNFEGSERMGAELKVFFFHTLFSG
jgi:hypothetical protein